MHITAAAGWDSIQGSVCHASKISSVNPYTLHIHFLWLRNAAKAFVNDKFVAEGTFIAVHVRPFPDTCLKVTYACFVSQFLVSNCIGVHHLFGGFPYLLADIFPIQGFWAKEGPLTIEILDEFKKTSNTSGCRNPGLLYLVPNQGNNHSNDWTNGPRIRKCMVLGWSYQGHLCFSWPGLFHQGTYYYMHARDLYIHTHITHNFSRDTHTVIMFIYVQLYMQIKYATVNGIN